MGKYNLYSKEELKKHRANGLDLSDKQNESFYAPGSIVEWSKEQFEEYMNSKPLWDEETKEYHRNLFTGKIRFSSTSFKHL